jgi:hypothetical protein
MGTGMKGGKPDVSSPGFLEESKRRRKITKF